MPRATINIAIPRPLTRAAAVRSVRERLAWDRNPPDQERRQGAGEARQLIEDDLNDRVALLRILEALRREPDAFLGELQRAEPYASEPAGRVPLSLFADFLWGPLSGGPDGTYARAFTAEFAAVASYVANLH